MDSRKKKVPGLSLESLRRQLLVAETAAHSLDFASDSLPIMTSLQSPTTRTLTAIVQNRAHFLALENEIQRAKAEEKALQSLVDESEALKARPLLGAFKGRVETEIEKATAERAREELQRSDAEVSATVLLAGGVRAAGILTTLNSDGEMVITTAEASSRPVALLPDERPTRFVPDEDDAVATDIAEQIVFTLPRDAAGTVLEVVPSTLLTAADRRREEARLAASKRSPLRGLHHSGGGGIVGSADGTFEIGGSDGRAGFTGLRPFPSAASSRASAKKELPSASALGSRAHSPLARRDAEPQSLTEALCWGAGGDEDYYRGLAMRARLAEKKVAKARAEAEAEAAEAAKALAQQPSSESPMAAAVVAGLPPLRTGGKAPSADGRSPSFNSGAALPSAGNNGGGSSPASSAHRYSFIFGTDGGGGPHAADGASGGHRPLSRIGSSFRRSRRGTALSGDGDDAPKTLKELLAEQQAMEVEAGASKAVYDTQIGKYGRWQERRLDLLTQFTRLEPDALASSSQLPAIGDTSSATVAAEGGSPILYGRRRGEASPNM